MPDAPFQRLSRSLMLGASLVFLGGATAQATDSTWNVGTGSWYTTTNWLGNTAMHGAASRGYSEVIALLAEKGAHVNVKNKLGKTPLDLVSVRLKADGEGQSRFKSSAEALLKAGASQARASTNPAP